MARDAAATARITRRILRSSTRRSHAAGAKHIVIFSVRSWNAHVVFEALMAARLRAEGHRVTLLSCDDGHPFCSLARKQTLASPGTPCGFCVPVQQAVWGNALPRKNFRESAASEDLIDSRVAALDLEGCRTFEHEGCPYGQLTYPGLAWELRRTVQESDTPLYRRAILCFHHARRGLESYLGANAVDTFILLNGDLGPEQSAASWVLTKKKVRFVTYDNMFYGLYAAAVNQSVWGSLVFAERAAPYAIGDGERAKAESLLESWRRSGGYQGHLLWNRSDLDADGDLRGALGLDGRPLAVAYTNLGYESLYLFKNEIFADQRDWLSRLISFFASRPQFQLAVRVHPAEALDATNLKPNESLYEFVTRQCGPLPENIRVIAPEAGTSSYRLGMLANAVLVFGSTIGLELAERKKRVITATRSHYSSRGFTCDPPDMGDYFSALSGLLESPSPLSDPERESLVDYVAWLFFKRLTPFEALDSTEKPWPEIRIKKTAELLSEDLPGVQRMARLFAGGPSWW